MIAQDVLPGLDQLSEGFAIFDRELRLVFCNKPFCDLRGYPEALCQPGVTLARAVLAQRDARRLEEQVAERIKTVSNRAPQDVDGQHRSPRDMDATPLPPVNIDRDGALRRLGGNEKLVAKMSARFRETQSDVAARIREAVTRGDVEGAMREAHTLKGLAGNIGAGDIAGMAAKLETMLK